jgi:hypothetical protein
VCRLLEPVIVAKNEVFRVVRTVNSGEVAFNTIATKQAADNARGSGYDFVVIDEAAMCPHLEYVWNNVVRPMLTDRKGDAWVMSTPKGRTGYFWQLYTDAQSRADWTTFRGSAYDNPFVHHPDIEEARLTMHDVDFRQEYLGEFVDKTSNPFAYGFDANVHVRPCHYDPEEALYVSFDFNVDPMTALVAQLDRGFTKFHVLREYRLQNSDVFEVCKRIKTDYPDAFFQITGDASGKARSTTSKRTNYDIIRGVLQVGFGQMRQPQSNPSIDNTRTLLNGLLKHHPDFRLDPSCTYLVDDLKYVEVNAMGDIDKAKDKHRTHLLDCLRYLAWTFQRDFVKGLPYMELPS